MMYRVTPVVKQLLIINIIFFVGSFNSDFIDSLFSLHFPENPQFKFWQIITHMFMHGSVIHILFNMLGLLVLGSTLEQMWGERKFLFFYITCGLGAAIIQILFNYYSFYSDLELLVSSGILSDDIIQVLTQGKRAVLNEWARNFGLERIQNIYDIFRTPMVGASGAIYGIAVAFALSFPNSKLMLLFPPIPIKAKYLVSGLIVIDLFFGFSTYSIGPFAHFAHIGGALTGFLIMYYWKKTQFNKNRWY